MAVKLFILGLPGSGKSTIINQIVDFVRERQWSTTQIYDYDILYQMFQKDTRGQFRPVAHSGFDILDLDVFDTALRKLEQNVRRHLLTTQLDEIIFIEFSRNNYEQAFRRFSQEVLKDAYFIHLNVEREICKKRVRDRTAKSNMPNNHYVSEYIFNTYYYGDDGIELPRILEKNYSIDSLRVRVINNSISQEDSSSLINQFAEIERFIDYIIENEALRLQETEPIRKLTDIEAQGELECN